MTGRKVTECTVAHFAKGINVASDIPPSCTICGAYADAGARCKLSPEKIGEHIGTELYRRQVRGESYTDAVRETTELAKALVKEERLRDEMKKNIFPHFHFDISWFCGGLFFGVAVFKLLW